MNLTLRRNDFGEFGIFGTLLDEKSNLVAITLEHSYEKDIGPNSWVYEPKLPIGEYKCVRGLHQLHNQVGFETFEVKGVPGHTGILFHAGNQNSDSDGCILLGRKIALNFDGPGNMITSSKNTFLKFMDLQRGVNEFTLTVVGDI